MPAASPGDVAIGLLGPLQVLVDGEPIEVTGGKRRGVLARLAMGNDAVVSTDRLVDDIWPAEAAERAVGTVRTYCSQLRRVVGSERIRSTPPGYTLSGVTLDVDRFDGLVSEAHLTADQATAVRLLDDALALWRGPALVEFAELPWARDQAARLDSVRLDAQHARFEARLALGDHHALAGELQVIVANHPLDERFWSQLMLALYHSGRQADALRVYQRARRTMIDELGIEPGVELRELEARIIAQDPTLLRRAPNGAAPAGPAPRIAPTPSPPPAPGLPLTTGAPAPLLPAAPVANSVPSDLSWVPPARLPFVGRETELRRCLDACTQPGNDLRVVLIEGDPGAGKTRLVSEVAHRVDQAGQLVLFGRGDEHLGEAYRLWVRVLGLLGIDQPDEDQAGPAASGAADDLVAEIERLESSPTTGDGDARRQRFFAAVARALTGASPGRLVVVLDDLQWADVDSLRVFRHLVLEAPHFVLTVVGVLRAGTDLPVLASTMLSLERTGAAIHFPLHELGSDEVSELVRHAAADEIESLARDLWKETGGNALFVTEVLRDRAERAEVSARPLEVPDSVREVIRARVQALPERARALLSVAAVVGTEIDGRLLGEIAQLSIEDTIGALDEASASRLIIPVEDDPGVFEFGHAVLRSSIFDDVPPARRLDLHRRTALALEQQPGVADQRRLAELARHWTAAGRFGDPAAAIRYRRQAGDAAARELGYEAAAAHYRGALALLDEHPPYDDPVERAQLLLALASIVNRAGDINAAKEACLEAATLAQRADQPELLARIALEVGGVLPTGNDLEDDDAVDLLRRARARVEPTSASYALMGARLAQLQVWSMPRSERRDLCDEAVAIARGLADDRLMSAVLLHRYWALNGPDELDERLTTAAELERLAVTLGDLELSLQAGKCRLHALLELGDFATAVELARKLTRIADQLQQPEYLRLASAFDAMKATVEGRFDEADRLAIHARDLLTLRGRQVHAWTTSYIERMPKAWIQGRFDRLVRVSEAFVTNDANRSMWHSFRAAVLAETGDAQGARWELEKLDLATYVAREPGVDWWSVMATSAIAAAAIGDQVTAKVVYDVLAPYAERNCVTGQIAFYGAAAHHLGVLAAVIGDEAAAREHLDAALDRHQRMGARPFEALSAAELARVLRSRPERADRADELQASARAIAEELGLDEVLRRLA